ncbi:MAG TPA: hypothetical protein VGP81_14585 [Pyrinomonadaceae bacterium]|nr:hypothetical protein [Pyrinomonadaceae bacterium]
MRIIRILALLLLGMWLGAAVFFSASVAPNVFGVLRGADLASASSLAGSIVSPLLATLNRAGFEIAIFLLVMSFFLTVGQTLIPRLAHLLSLAVLATTTAVGHWVIAARIAALRTALTLPIDQIPPSDERRIAFDSLHRYSVLLFAVAILAAAVAFVLIGCGREPSRQTSPNQA